MSFLKNLFKKDSGEAPKTATTSAPELQPPQLQATVSEYVAMGIAVPASNEEKELVSVITSSIMVGVNPDSKVKVHHVSVVDEDAEVATVLASVAAAKDKPNSTYRLKKITKLN